MTRPAIPRRRAWELWYVRRARWMSRLRRAGLRLTHRHCTVRIHPTAYLGPRFHLSIAEHGTFIVGPWVQFRRGFVCEISGEGRVEIGSGSIFTSDALVQCTTSIVVGERCMFGQALLMVDGNHRFRGLDTPMLEQGYDYQPIVIEDDVTVTTKCTIIGAHIGERAVIGANTLVGTDVPAHCVVLGVPGRVVDYFGPEGQRPATLRRRAAEPTS